jgi:hypothetical protein
MFDMDEVIRRLIIMGPSEAMKEDERAMGFTPVSPGEVPWLAVADWQPTGVISIKGKIVRIVAIKAIVPRTGAFSRLITGIAKAGLRPVVVEPMFDMPDILRRWGWSHRIIGSGKDRQEVWQPSLTWCEQRATYGQYAGE